MESDNYNRNCDLLFEYLRSILYDIPIQQPDLDKLDLSFRRLGQGMQFLQQAVEEMHAYTADLSKGNLSGAYPSRENFLCAHLKGLHSNLNHLTWQAKQVAAGDYSQHVSYLGDFSDAFNTMIQQLKEREDQLKEEAVKIQQRAHVIDEYNAFLIEITRKRNEWILVVDEETPRILYCNKQEQSEQITDQLCSTCEQRLDFREQILDWKNSEQYKVWETQDENQRFYRITTFHIEWRGCSAYAHIAEDVTRDKMAAQKLSVKAYDDPLTGIHNRLFFEEYMVKLFAEGRDAILCYIDLDGLKFVNDNYGHNEGDEYIRCFVSAVQKAMGSKDEFARIGGDEFCLVLPGAQKPATDRMLAQIRQRFADENTKPYPVSFSYGTVDISASSPPPSLADIIKTADTAMYQFKSKMKKKR